MGSQRPNVRNALTIDVEDWFHILGTQNVPDQGNWNELPSRLERNMEAVLGLLSEYKSKATFFWLGWAAKRFPHLVRLCHEQGHEVASHGYHHLLAFEIGQEKFQEDARRAKELLEDLVGAPVRGFRVPGFSFTPETPWAYEELAKAGYAYSSSIFPASRGHGGFVGASTEEHPVQTPAGTIWEFPITTVGLARKRICLFGGGYLRITPLPVLLGISGWLNAHGRSVIYYLHPREIDPGQPRLLRLPAHRYFKYYANLRTTENKLRRLCEALRFVPLGSSLPDVV